MSENQSNHDEKSQNPDVKENHDRKKPADSEPGFLKRWGDILIGVSLFSASFLLDLSEVPIGGMQNDLITGVFYAVGGGTFLRAFRK